MTLPDDRLNASGEGAADASELVVAARLDSEGRRGRDDLRSRFLASLSFVGEAFGFVALSLLLALFGISAEAVSEEVASEEVLCEFDESVNVVRVNFVEPE